MELTVIITLMIVGIILLILEIFLIPGFSVSGVAGILSILGSIYYAYHHLGPMAGHITLASGILLMAVAVWVFIKAKTLERLSLKTEIKSKNDPLENMSIQTGDKGITVSRLAPMGKIKIAGRVIEAKSMGDFIDEETEVTVVQVDRTNVLVEIS